jgi:alpha-L-fucosidase
MYERIYNFEKMGFGMFVHFGIYSVLGKGEWAKNRLSIPEEDYFPLMKKFKVRKTWAKELVSVAKRAGCKYITLTTRHHDGFSLYDTLGLNEYDAPHSAAGRDLVREFVDECNRQGIVPFFYHTLIDWYNKDSESDFPKYIDYLVRSVEILCTQYGKIGGLWFDGFWDKPNADWQFDRLYGMIRKHQPDAMIINNTGMSNMGIVGHPEIDSVTFERGKPHMEDYGPRPVATEMCQIFGNHWGYAENDLLYKSIPQMLSELIHCRANNANMLLNVGPMGNGLLRPIDKAMMLEIGKWIRYNKGFIYEARHSDISVENAILLKGEGKTLYAVSEVQSKKDIVHGFSGDVVHVKLDAKIKSAVWIDNGEPIEIIDGCGYLTVPFKYGTNMVYRVAEIVLDRS